MEREGRWKGRLGCRISKLYEECMEDHLVISESSGEEIFDIKETLLVYVGMVLYDF